MQDNTNLATQPLISTRDLAKRFGTKHILNGIDIDINKGERIVVVGPSGSGKSTFLRCLNLLEPPTTGKIFFENNLIFQNESVLVSDEIAALKGRIKSANKELANDKLGRKQATDGFKSQIAELRVKHQELRKNEVILDREMDNMINVHRQKIGMVFQQFNLFPHLTVMQNITLAPIKLGKLSEAEAIEKAEAYLKRIGLTEKADSYPNQLSGGQMQRIAIVRSLIMNPDVMLFDEPTSALDPEMVGEVLDFIIELAAEGMTMAIVTHEMNFAKKIATKILFMDEGKIIESASPSEFFDNPKADRLKEFLSKILHN